jgi:hypothetical protein
MQTDMLEERQGKNVESYRTHTDRKGMLAERHPGREVSKRKACASRSIQIDKHAVRTIRKVGLHKKFTSKGNQCWNFSTSKGARNRVGIGLPGIYMLAELIPWNQFSVSLKV